MMFFNFSDSNSISFLSAMLSHPFSSKVLSARGLFLLSGNQPRLPGLFGGMGSELDSSPGCSVCQAIFSLSPERQLKSKDNDKVIDFDIEMV